MRPTLTAVHAEGVDFHNCGAHGITVQCLTRQLVKYWNTTRNVPDDPAFYGTKFECYLDDIDVSYQLDSNVYIFESSHQPGYDAC